MENLNAILEKHSIEEITLEEAKDIVAEKARNAFEALSEGGELNCSPAVTAIWLEAEETLKFLKETDFSNEEDSSVYNFSSLTEHPIVDRTNVYLYFVGDNVQEFLLISW